MPIALRPDTTATRADTALIKRDHRSGTRIDDFAAYSKVLQYAFQRHRVAVDDVARQSRTLAGARRRQEIERGERVAVSRAAHGRSRRSPPTRCRTFVTINAVVVGRGFAAESIEAWLLPWTPGHGHWDA